MHAQFHVEVCYFANGLNMQKIMKFLMCASNIYTICNWETD